MNVKQASRLGPPEIHQYSSGYIQLLDVCHILRSAKLHLVSGTLVPDLPIFGKATYLSRRRACVFCWPSSYASWYQTGIDGFDHFRCADGSNRDRKVARGSDLVIHLLALLGDTPLETDQGLPRLVVGNPDS